MTNLTDLDVKRLIHISKIDSPWTNFLLNITTPGYIPTAKQQQIWLKIYQRTFFRFYKLFRPQLTQDESYEISQKACLGLTKTDFSYVQKVVENAHKKALAKNRKERTVKIPDDIPDKRDYMKRIDYKDLIKMITLKDEKMGTYLTLVVIKHYTPFDASQEMGLDKLQHFRLRDKISNMFVELQEAGTILKRKYDKSKP